MKRENLERALDIDKDLREIEKDLDTIVDAIEDPDSYWMMLSNQFSYDTIRSDLGNEWARLYPIIKEILEDKKQALEDKYASL